MYETKVICLLGVLALLMAACGGGSEGEKKALSANALEEVLGLEPGEFQSGGNRESAVQTQEEIAICMKAQGFEYVPFVPEEGFFEIQVANRSEEWVEEWGFGISTLHYSEDLVGPDLKGNEYGSGAAEEDPNQKIVESLTPEEQEAYNKALYGGTFGEDVEETDSAEEDTPESLGDFGCFGEALLKQPLFRVFEEFEDELAALEEKYEADPRLEELEQKLKGCIKEEGLDYPGEEEYSEQTFEKLFEVQAIPEAAEEGVDPASPETDPTADPLPQDSDEEAADPEDYKPEPLTAEEQTKLAEIQEEEIEIAKAAYKCGFFDGEYRVEQRKIEDEYLTTFVEENRAVIEGLK